MRLKRRKLKRLWREIERIQQALKSVSSTTATEETERRKSAMENGKTTKPNAKTKRKHWRRRMMQRLKILSRQILDQQQQKSPSLEAVEKLYALLALEMPETGKKQKTKNGNSPTTGSFENRRNTRRSKKLRGRLRGGGNSTIISQTTIAPQLAKNGKGNGRVIGNRKRPSINVTNAPNVARNGIKKGEAGSTCTSHKNCKPGFCCHQLRLRDALTSANSTVNECVDHRLKQNQPCANSCQCDSRLQCFVSRKDKHYQKRIQGPDASSIWSALEQSDEEIGDRRKSADGHCKIPDMDDVLHGFYVTSDQAVFKPNS